MYRALGLIDSLPGLALVNAVASVSFATLILGGYFRTLPRDIIDAARVDGAGRSDVLLRVVIPIARPGIAAVALLVAVLAWNDFAGALVLIQDPDAFTVQLALTRFANFYATDQGLTFAGLAIIILPPLLLFLVLQRSFMAGFTAGIVRR
jgi:raffinose/stachyose/melibiose transport system permease protein